MNDKFDELAKGLAQSVTRRGALKKFGVGLAGIALASLGILGSAKAAPDQNKRHGNCNHCNPANSYGCQTTACYLFCSNKCNTGI